MKPAQSLPRITLEGVQLPDGFCLATLRLVQRLDAPSQCELCWSTPWPDPDQRDQPDFPAIGRLLTVALASHPLFSGEITALEYLHEPSGGFTLRLRAYDALARLQRRQSLSTHVEVTTAELLRTLCTAADMTVEEAVEEEGPLWSRIIPRFPHDLALLRHYCGRSGLHFHLREGAVCLLTPTPPTAADRELVLGKDLFEAAIEDNRLRQVDAVQVLGWDPHTGVARQGITPLPFRSDPDPGPALARTLPGRPLAGEAEALALARSEAVRLRHEGLTFEGVAEGDAQLRPGMWVTPRGLATGGLPPFLLTAVVHSVDTRQGYQCELSSRPQPQDPPSPMQTLVLGEVCDVADPESRGRVQVLLDSYAEAVSPWLLVTQPGAGRDKGLVALPEVGDQVVVALPEGDPARGIVLGGIYGGEGPPRGLGRTRRGRSQRPYLLTTRGGQRIEFNDGDGSIRLQNRSGSYLHLTPEGIVLHAAGTLVLESPEEPLTLRARTIDMEQA
ncbi:phage baseplate assembly protein V [Ectothiorhodospira lacustris]|uniref:phage baseplate assembly protein V n=1 Tax=Ectothiorhodospira lacustris TaxID=2899127 RepID=UPI001EE80E0A|nr:phage baseplate assembly protein V [Ectothiorhodospira lacustris]MCG5501138.1 phage baseplate assembly protein V [Ectothiorhodospira lacustris]